MPNHANHLLKLFADDSKLLGIIKNLDDVNVLQNYIDALVNWATSWKMLFNYGKCKSMLVTKSGRSLTNHQFFMCPTSGESHAISTTSSEKDLGITLTNNFKFNEQATHAANKASIALGQLKRTFRFWTVKNFKLLYSTYVRPHLEYAAPAWSPHLSKDITIIEKVQRRATKLVPFLKNLPYQERLKAFDLTTLYTRRLRGDLIQYFKFIKNMNIISWHRVIQSVPSTSQNLRGAGHRIRRQFVKNCSQREAFFTNGVVPYWNDLPENVIQSLSINQFKNRLYKHIKTNGLSSGTLLLSGLPR